jgi:WD40 repeat protein
MVEYAAAVGTIAGAVVTVISGKIIYLAVPLSASVLLNLVNRRRFELLSRNSTNAAITRIYRQLAGDIQTLQAITRTLASGGEATYLGITRQTAQMQEFISSLLRGKMNPIHQDIEEIKEQYTNLQDSLSSVVQYLNSTSLSPRVDNLEQTVQQFSDKWGDVSLPPEQWLIAQLEDLKQQIKELQFNETKGDNRRQIIAEYSQIESWLMSKLDELKQEVQEIQQTLKIESGKSQKTGEKIAYQEPQLPFSSLQSKIPSVQPLTSNVALPKWNCVYSLSGHSDWVSAIVFSADAQKIASASFDQSIKVWNYQTGELIRVITENSGVVYTLAFSGYHNLLAQGGSEHNIKLWDLETGALVEICKEHSGSVRAIAITNDGKTLASGSYDGTIKLWNLETAQEIRTFTKHTGTVSAIAFSRDGQILASGGGDGIVKLWHWSTGQLLHSLCGDLGVIAGIAFHPQEPMLVSASSDRTLKLWHLGTRDRLYTFSGHTGGVTSACFSPDGQTLFSASADGSIIIWDLATGKQLTTLSFAPAQAIVSMALSIDGQTLAAGNVKGELKIWQLNSVN